MRGRIGRLSGIVDEIRGLAQRPPLPVGLGARTLGFRRGADGVTPKQEPQGRFIETRDVQDGRRRLLRVAGLRAIVLALKLRDGADRRGIGGIVRENGLGGSREVRAEAPGLDDRDFDPERPDLFSEHLRESLDTPLGRRVRAATDRADASSHGRELEDPARSLTSHHRDSRLGQVHDPKEIGLNLGAEVLNGRVLDCGKVPIAGVVDQHIEAAEGVNSQLDGRDRCTLLGDIQRDGAHVVAVTLNQIGELLWITGSGDQLVARCEDGLSDRATQPPSASRDQPYLCHRIPLITKLMFSFIVAAPWSCQLKTKLLWSYSPNRCEQAVPMRKSRNPKPRPRGRPRSDASKEAILRAAYRLLKTRGIASVSAQELVRQAGVSTATLYRWWKSKEAVMLDAFLARVKPALAPPLEGSPLERLHQSVVRGAAWLHSKDAPVAVRLISDVQADPVLRRLFLERFYLPRRAMNVHLVQQAIAAGELPRDTDADLLIDALTGPLYFRRIIGHAPVSEAFANELASRVLQAFRRPVGL